MPGADVLIGRGGGRLVPVAVATLLALGAGVRGVVAVGSSTPVSDGAASGRLLLDAGAALVTAAATWSVVGMNARASAGLALLLTGWLLPSWAVWSVWPQQVALVMVAAAPLTAAGAAMVVLSWSSMPGRRSRRIGWLVSGAGVVAVAVVALGYDPFADPACSFRCGHRTPPLAGVVSTQGVVLTAALITLGVVAVAAAQLPRSRASRPVAVAVAAGLVVLVAVASAPLLHWTVVDRPFGEPGVQTLAVLMTGGAVLAAGIASSRVRRAIERLASGLVDPEAGLVASGGIRSVAYAVPGEDRWVDARGHEVTRPPGASKVLDLSDGSGPALRLELARSGGGPLGGLASATRLALANARLAAVGRARLIEVQASQRRIVATRDGERRRIERDLHDGVQQRLVSVAFHLQLAMRHAGPGMVEQLTRAESEVHDALGRLRALAHGVFPTVLTDEGLGPALEDLVTGGDRRVALDSRVRDDVPEDAAMAVYATVSAVLSAMRPASAVVQVCVAEDVGRLTVRIVLVDGVLDATSHALGGAVDRVGALGGRFSVEGDGTRLVAVVPCAS